MRGRGVVSQYVDPARVNAPGVSDADKLAFVIEASGEADSYLMKRYTLPLLSWGADLTGHTRKLARYAAFDDRGFDPSNPADQAIVNGRRDAIAWLTKVAAGDVELVGAIDSTPALEEAGPIHSGDAAHDWQWGKRRSEDCE